MPSPNFYNFHRSSSNPLLAYHSLNYSQKTPLEQPYGLPIVNIYWVINVILAINKPVPELRLPMAVLQ